MNIYGLSESWLSLDAVLEETGGEVTPEVAEMIAALVDESPQALERAAHYLQALDGAADVAKARRAALAATVERTEGKAAKVREVMTAVLVRVGKPVRLPEFTLSTTTRTSYAFAVSPDCQVFEVDDRFLRYRDPELNKAALTEAQKAGELPASIVCVESSSTSLMLRVSKPKEKTCA